MEGAKDHVTSLACFFFLWLWLWLVVCRAETQPQDDQLPVKTYAYASFQSTDSPSTLRVLKDASIHGGTLQLTPDGRNGDGLRAHKSGSVLLAQPFTIWRRLDDDESHAPAPVYVGRIGTGEDNKRVRVVSFNSTFSFRVAQHKDRALPGEGLAFVVAPSTAGPPPGSAGGFLGLTNSTFEASSPATTNRFVAVEFDTAKQSYDPDDNHVGLDIGTVVSAKTASLADFGITMATENGTAAKNYTVWIEYDGVARHVWVYMDVRGKPRPASPVLDAPLDLSEHVPEQSYFGFSGSTGASTVELSGILDWTLTVETFPEKGQKASKYWWILIAAVFIFIVIYPAIGCIVTLREERAMKTREQGRLERLRSLAGMPTELVYEELERATGKFSERLREGWHGGYGPGSVYKGLLPSAGDGRPEATQVAVKTYNEDCNKFGNEIQLTNRLRHRNIVPVIGWCYHRGWTPKMLMVHKHKHMCNGSLDQHIFRRDGVHHERRPPLSWESRYRIVADVASGLRYMHHQHSSVVLHGYVKPSSVMLDASLRARISDFVLARVVTVAHGRREDARPADVFAFGALVLEVVTGRYRRLDDPVFPRLWDWVWQLHGRGTLLGAVDQILGVAGFDQDEARRLLLLGLACTRSSRRVRPTMLQVLQILSKSAPPPEMAPVKPPEDYTTQDNFDDSFHFPPPPELTQCAYSITVTLTLHALARGTCLFLVMEILLNSPDHKPTGNNIHPYSGSTQNNYSSSNNTFK
uniref:Uncharacterized protein n=1 Tax=Avena sativa TaxID=4498 RepID=A0ACD5WN47_AVESA